MRAECKSASGSIAGTPVIEGQKARRRVLRCRFRLKYVGSCLIETEAFAYEIRCRHRCSHYNFTRGNRRRGVGGRFRWVGATEEHESDAEADYGSRCPCVRRQSFPL